MRRFLVIVAVAALPACAALISLGDEPSALVEGGSVTGDDAPPGETGTDTVDGAFDAGPLFVGADDLLDLTFGVRGGIEIESGHANALAVTSAGGFIWVGQSEPNGVGTRVRYQRFDGNGKPIAAAVDQPLSTMMPDSSVSESGRATAIVARPDGTFWTGITEDFRPDASPTTLVPRFVLRRTGIAGETLMASTAPQKGGAAEVVEIAESPDSIAAAVTGAPDLIANVSKSRPLAPLPVRSIAWSGENGAFIAVQVESATPPAFPNIRLSLFTTQLDPSSVPDSGFATITPGNETINNVDVLPADGGYFAMTVSDSVGYGVLTDPELVTQKTAGVPFDKSVTLSRMVASGTGGGYVLAGCTKAPAAVRPWLKGLSLKDTDSFEDPSFHVAGELVIDGLPNGCVKDIAVDDQNRILILVVTPGSRDRIYRLKK